MPKIEQNAQGFKYILTWQRDDIADSEMETEQVDLAEAWHYVVPTKYDTPYIPFIITVKGANAIGESTTAPTRVIARGTLCIMSTGTTGGRGTKTAPRVRAVVCARGERHRRYRHPTCSRSTRGSVKRSRRNQSITDCLMFTRLSTFSPPSLRRRVVAAFA